MNTYSEVIAYLYHLLPVFHRDGKAAYKPGLDTILKFCEYLGNPQKRLRTVHVGGTNGKGSTSHLLAAIMQSAGYRVGLYTSPHLKDFRERIRIDGTEISEEFVMNFVNTHRVFIETEHPSFFEVTVAMAFQYFAEREVDIVIVEVGVGGRLDSTNIISPEVSIITNIGWDHTDLLGDTLEKIAYEKAGIIKVGIPVVISELQDEVKAVFEKQARLQKAPLFYASQRFTVTSIEVDEFSRKVICLDHSSDSSQSYELGLLGSYQISNSKAVLQAVKCLIESGWKISDEAVNMGFRDVIEMTGLKGRWQKLSKRPLIFCDTAHNESGMREVLHTIDSIPHSQLWILIGVVRDKDFNRILPILPLSARYICCEASNPRSLPAKELNSILTSTGYESICIADVNNALTFAKQNSSTEDLIIVTGSTYLVAELFH